MVVWGAAKQWTVPYQALEPARMRLRPQQLVEMMPTIQVRGGSHLLGIGANDSGGDRFTNTCGACDVNHLSCVHGGVQESAGETRQPFMLRLWTSWTSSVAVTAHAPPELGDWRHRAQLCLLALLTAYMEIA